VPGFIAAAAAAVLAVGVYRLAETLDGAARLTGYSVAQMRRPFVREQDRTLLIVERGEHAGGHQDVAAAPKASRHRHRVRFNQPRPRRRHCVADRPKEQVQRPPPTRREALAFQRLSVTSRVATLEVAPPSHRHLVAHSHRAPGKIRTCDTRFRRAVLYPLSYEGGRVSQSPAVHRRAIVPRRRLG
jgi:hypothetical protein